MSWSSYRLTSYVEYTCGHMTEGTSVWFSFSLLLVTVSVLSSSFVHVSISIVLSSIKVAE